VEGIPIGLLSALLLIPMGGNKNSLVNVIAIVDLKPNCELPGPAIQFPHFHSSEN
jgi:hypothetical protein